MRHPSERQPSRHLTPPLMRNWNMIGVLGLLRDHGEISRAHLASLSRLSKPTISDLVTSLIHKGLVIETGPGKPSDRGGKKPTMLRFNPDYGCLIAVEIGPEEIQVALADLDRQVRRTWSGRALAEAGSEAVLAQVSAGIANVMADAPSRLRLISIAAPGIVDVTRGIVRETDNIFAWRNVDLRAELSSTFGVPVIVDNDVNLAALAEMESGAGQGVPNFVLINLSTGIGAGIVLGGRLHHGSHYAAGEIGHMVLDARAGSGPYRPRGYLESFVGADRIAARVQELALRKGSPMAQLLPGRPEWEALLECAAQGDPASAELVGDLAHYLSAAVVNLSAAYDPDLVILAGVPFPPLLDRIRELAMKLVPWPIEISLSASGPHAPLQGAIFSGLAAIFEQISAELRIASREETSPGGMTAPGRTALVASES